MGQKAARRTYMFIKGAVRFFYPKLRLAGAEALPDEAVVFVGNHSQIHGPIAAELYMPVARKTWCAGEMMRADEVADYAFRDFWSQNPKWTHGFYKALAKAITPLALVIFNQAETIPVYHDNRVLGTFRASIEALEAGQSLVIFPEHGVLGEFATPVLYDFQDRFIDLARLYHRRTGKALAFVPMYLAPRLRLLTFGAPIRFDPQAPMDEERARIKAALMEAITALARDLPRHRVVPYRPGKRREDPYNRPKEEKVS